MSDELAKQARSFNGFRSGNTISGLNAISKKIQSDLSKQFPGLKIQQPLDFRIFSRQEFIEKFGPQAPFFIVD